MSQSSSAEDAQEYASFRRHPAEEKTRHRVSKRETCFVLEPARRQGFSPATWAHSPDTSATRTKAECKTTACAGSQWGSIVFVWLSRLTQGKAAQVQPPWWLMMFYQLPCHTHTHNRVSHRMDFTVGATAGTSLPSKSAHRLCVSITV